MQQAADAQMGFRGYTKVRGGTPEMVLHIHARVEQQIDSSQVDPETHRCDQDECRTYVYDQGTLLIDIIDAPHQGAHLAGVGRKKPGRRGRESGLDEPGDRPRDQLHLREAAGAAAVRGTPLLASAS